jgi:phage tail-like protein
MAPLNTTFRFVLEVDSESIASFKKVEGFGREIKVITNKSVNEKGKMVITNLPGPVEWEQITLEMPLENSKTMAEWAKKAEQGDPSALRNGSIVMYDAQGTEVKRWNFEGGWLAKISYSALDASSEEVAVQTLKIAHQGIQEEGVAT